MKKNINTTKKINLTLVLSAALIAGAFTLLYSFTPVPDGDKWTAPATAEKEKNPFASNPASIAAGKDVYKKKCFDCHGSKGKGDGPKSAELDKAPQDFTKSDFQKESDGSLFWKIGEGKKPMPAFKHELTKDQRWQVIIYIRTLK